MKTLKNMTPELGAFIRGGKQVFVVIKPGALGLTQIIINRIEEEGWHLTRIRTKRLLLSEAKELYKVHKKEDFYKSLCEYMASDISTGLIFTKPGTSDESDFKEIAKIKDEVRKDFGESDMRNVMHSSDNLENMLHEASVYFYIP